jgi:hypothetical protein
MRVHSRLGVRWLECNNQGGSFADRLIVEDVDVSRHWEWNVLGALCVGAKSRQDPLPSAVIAKRTKSSGSHLLLCPTSFRISLLASERPHLRTTPTL